MAGLRAFTEHAKSALKLAEEEALRLNHGYVGTEHLLIGVIREYDSVGAAVLRNVGVDLNRARSAAELIVGRGDRPATSALGISPGAKRALETSVDEARAMGHDYIGTEHLLLALARKRKDIATGMLASMGVTQQRIRTEVTRTLAQAPPQPAPGDREPATIIDGKAIAAEVRGETKARADRLHERGIIPGLALVLAGDNPSSLSYVRSKGDAAEQAGIYSDMFHFPENVDEQTLISRIMDLNEDNRFHAILVQLPLPRQLRESQVVGSIDPAKDVDGVTAVSMGRLLRGEPGPWPATPAGVVEMLHRSGNPPAGKHVVVCGRSNIVGKPLAGILMQKNDRANATVTLCHTGTQ